MSAVATSSSSSDQEWEKMWEKRRMFARELLVDIHNSTPEKDRLDKQYIVKSAPSSGHSIKEEWTFDAGTEVEAFVMCFDEIVKLGDDKPHNPYEDIWEFVEYGLKGGEVKKFLAMSLEDAPLEEVVQLLKDYHDDIIEAARDSAGYNNEGEIYDRGFELAEVPPRRYPQRISSSGRTIKAARA